MAVAIRWGGGGEVVDSFRQVALYTIDRHVSIFSVVLPRIDRKHYQRCGFGSKCLPDEACQQLD